jgi:hypothetical protein
MKKKELIGNFKDGGADYRPKGNPPRVNVHDQLFACGLPRGCASLTPAKRLHSLTHFFHAPRVQLSLFASLVPQAPSSVLETKYKN